MLDVIAPPSWYDMPYPGPVIEITLPIARITTFCGLMMRDGKAKMAPGQIIYACSKIFPGGCLVVLPVIDNVVTLTDQSNLRRHEIAHCNGWPYDHPK